MNQPYQAPTSPDVRRAHRWNVVWVVPILAALIGGWLLYRNFATQGPTATIRFETAEEIDAGKTEVRCRSVKVGMVKQVMLGNDLNSVSVVIEVDPHYESLLREGSRFWVVKPRLSGAEISGLGTLIQGAYIELDPGAPQSRRSDRFDGLEIPPATSSSVPGRRLTLTSHSAGTLLIGAPIDYRGFEVGRIEGRELCDDGATVNYNAFISEEYSHLITRNTRFWNTSGIEINSSTRGVVLRTPSLQAMVSGGVSFGLPGGMKPGEAVADGTNFTLFTDEESAQHEAFKPTLQFLLRFDQSIQGLTTDSAVEFRGIPIGRIAQISYHLIDVTNDPRIPVLVEIDPKRVQPRDRQLTHEEDIAFFKHEITKGLRAGLKTTSYITGTVHIDFDYHPTAKPAEMDESGTFPTFPTVATGFTQIEAKLATLIDRLQNMPVESTMASLGSAVDETKAVAEAARQILDDPKLKGLPTKLEDSLQTLKTSVASIGPNSSIQDEVLVTLDELRATLRSLKDVADLISEKPNALIFGRGSSDDKKRSSSEKTTPRLGAPHH